jgi:hypothetical protein
MVKLVEDEHLGCDERVRWPRAPSLRADDQSAQGLLSAHDDHPQRVSPLGAKRAERSAARAGPRWPATITDAGSRAKDVATGYGSEPRREQ